LERDTLKSPAVRAGKAAGAKGKETAMIAKIFIYLLWITKLLTGGPRVDDESEIAGLDHAVHGGRAFENQ
jgi:hypothetical protein